MAASRGTAAAAIVADAAETTDLVTRGRRILFQAKGYSSDRRSIAPHDVDALGRLSAFAARNGHRLRGAIRHVGSGRGDDIRREPMNRVPGHIIGVGVMDVA